jgi:hypothetical protein
MITIKQLIEAILTKFLDFQNLNNIVLIKKKSQLKIEIFFIIFYFLLLLMCFSTTSQLS